MTRWVFLIVLALAAVALVVGCGQKEEQTQMQESTLEVQVASEKIFDPVCGMEVDPETAISAEYKGKIYYFCSADCHQQFMQHPARYMPMVDIIDPVCGMQIGPETSFKAEYEGKTYYFCSAECHEKFMQAPEKYMTPEGHHMEGKGHEGHGH